MVLIVFALSCVAVVLVMSYLIDFVSYEILKWYFLYLPVGFIFLVLLMQGIAPKKYFEVSKLTEMNIVRSGAPAWFRLMPLVAQGYCVGSIVGFLISIIRNFGYEALRR